jgi:murein DD-endopeptidase MepM/ murein hydrolase activator NlpD
MTRKMTNAAMLGLVAMGLSACASTPAYPVTSQAAPRPTSTPPAAAPRAAETPPESAPTTPVPAPAPVLSTDLAPVPPSSAATPSTEAAPLPAVATVPPPATPRRAPAHYLASGKVVSPRHMYRDYRVVAHDHLDAIARDFQVTPEEMLQANHLKDANHLLPGQHLKIPVEKAYVAEPGDTLAVIARRFSVSVADLSDINDLSERARLHAGDQIALPAGYHDRGPVLEEAARPARYGSTARIYAEDTPTGGVYTPSPYALAAGRAAQARSGEAASIPAVPTAPEPQVTNLSDAQIVALARSRFAWPVSGDVVAKFGVQGLGVRNDGIDVRAPLGTVVHAAAPGDVVYAGDQIPGFGNLVLLQHADGWVTAYAHLQHMSVQMRQTVTQGQEIGQVGTTGGLAEPQLHFEVRYKASAGEKAKPVDPQLVLPTGKPASSF